MSYSKFHSYNIQAAGSYQLSASNGVLHSVTTLSGSTGFIVATDTASGPVGRVLASGVTIAANGNLPLDYEFNSGLYVTAVGPVNVVVSWT